MIIQVDKHDHTFPAHPVLLPGYQVIPLAAEAICVRRLDHSFVIRGPAAVPVSHLLQAMDGIKDVAQLAEQTHIPSTTLIQILQRLSQARVISEGNDLLEMSTEYSGAASLLAQLYRPEQTDYTHAMKQVTQQLREQVMFVIGYSDLVDLLCHQLTSSGVEHIYPFQPAQLGDAQVAQLSPTFFLYVERTNDYHSALQINSMALLHNIPWIAGWQAGFSLNMTHVMVPGENACFECFLLRQRNNYMHFTADLAYEQFSRNGQLALSFQESVPAFDHMLISLMSMRAIGSVLGYRPQPPAPTLLEFSPIEMQSLHHPVLRLPHCPACGPLDIQPQTYPYLDMSFFDTRSQEERV